VAASIQVCVVRREGQPVLLAGLGHLVRRSLDVQRQLAELCGDDVEAAELCDLTDLHAHASVGRLRLEAQELRPNAEFELALQRGPLSRACHVLSRDSHMLRVQRARHQVHAGAADEVSHERMLGLLEQRSPGARSGAELTKIKHKRTAAAADPTELIEHALGKEFPPDAVADVTEGLGLGSPEQLLALAEPGRVKDFVPPASNGGGGSGGTVPGFIGGGGGGHGGGGGGRGGDDVDTGKTGEVTTTQFSAAVPEPGTWATMLVGMGLCGFGLRRRKRRPDGDTEQRCAVA